MYRMSGAELVIRLLERQGIDCISGIPGGANLPLYDALSHSKRIRHVLARHEQGAGFIAQGMAVPPAGLPSSSPPPAPGPPTPSPPSQTPSSTPCRSSASRGRCHAA